MSSKDHCILKYNEYKRTYGAVPKFREFCKFAEITEGYLVTLYGRDAFAQLQRECGDVANKLMLERIPRDHIMKQYGDLALELNALPNSADWIYRKLVPGPSGLKKSPHSIKWSEFPQLFADWVEAERITGYDRVVALTKGRGTTKSAPQDLKDRKFNALVREIRLWSPARRRNTEGEYKIELRSHLKSRGYGVNEEFGESNFDLLVDNIYAIELKKDPNLSEYDRLFGQLARHLQHQLRVVALIFDVPREDNYSQFSALVDAYLNKDKNTVEIMKK